MARKADGKPLDWGSYIRGFGTGGVVFSSLASSIMLAIFSFSEKVEKSAKSSHNLGDEREEIAVGHIQDFLDSNKHASRIIYERLRQQMIDDQRVTPQKE